MLTDTKKSEYAKVQGLDFHDIKWTGGFWKEITDSCSAHMVPQLQKMFEGKEISHVVENFRICANEAEGDFDGTVFGDGDFYKWMESEVYAAAMENNSERLAGLEKYVKLIAKAQQPDGYISTKQIIESRKGTGLGRMGDINEFEVYNMGHLFTSACLYTRLTGKEDFLEVAKKAAGYLQNMYDEAERTGNVQTAVCPSHYMGLIEMYRITGEDKYLKLANKAICLRDSVKEGLDDNQDSIPLKQHDKIIGHAVRATYLYAGVADLYAEMGDEEYLSMLHKVWKNMVDKKIYLTGGIGAIYNGMSPYGNFFIDHKVHQAFGYEYQLPNITAYNETCASIGLLMWAYRMFLIEPKAEYFDMIERVMLNINLAAVSLDGKKYFYENPLRRAKKLDYELVWPLTRSEYILSYCCPPNLARALMQSEEYTYVRSENAVWTGMYGDSEAHIVLDNGADFILRQETEYPYDGKICLTVQKVNNDAATDLMLRIPAWCEQYNICVNGRQLPKPKCSGMYIKVSLESLENAKIELELDMPVRFTIANTMIEEDSGQAAVEKGPLVYCMETPDVQVESLDDICLDTNESFTEAYEEIAGRNMHVLYTKVWKEDKTKEDREKLYRTLVKGKKEKTEARLIPYFAWDNREYGEMRIWIPYSL